MGCTAISCRVRCGKIRCSVALWPKSVYGTKHDPFVDGFAMPSEPYQHKKPIPFEFSRIGKKSYSFFFYIWRKSGGIRGNKKVL